MPLDTREPKKGRVKMIDRPIHVWGYGRVSSVGQEISPHVQKRACQSWVEMQKNTGRLPESAVYQWFCDQSSSWEFKFPERPAGEAILMNARSGDIIVTARFDRAFRNVLDAISVHNRLQEQGVSMVILDFNIDTSTNVGRAAFQMMAVMKEFELREIRRRTQEALYELRLQGYIVGPPTIGWKKGPNPKKAVPDYRQRRICEEIVRLKDEEGLSFYKIMDLLRKQGVRWKKRRFSNGGKMEPLTQYMVTKWYYAAKAGYPLCVTTPSDGRASR